MIVDKLFYLRFEKRNLGSLAREHTIPTQRDKYILWLMSNISATCNHIFQLLIICFSLLTIYSTSASKDRYGRSQEVKSSVCKGVLFQLRSVFSVLSLLACFFIGITKLSSRSMHTEVAWSGTSPC